MKISKLSEGMTFKNYKELCLFLGIKPMTSTNSKKAQFKELERYCTYTKQGQKITINEIFLEPLDKEDLRIIGTHSKYVDHIKFLTLNLLSEIEEHRILLTKDRLLEALGMVNNRYLHKEESKKILLKQDGMNKFYINHFFMRANNSLTRILFDSLNSLKRRFLITFEEIITIVRLNSNNIEVHTEATIEEKAIVASAKYKVLLDMNLNSMMQVIFKFKTEEFYRRSNKILKTEHNIEYTYKQIELIFTKEDVLNELSIIELKRHKKELNIKVVDTINVNTWNVYHKQIKDYDEKLMDFILNERPAIGRYTEGQFTGFKLRDDFPEIQMELCDYLIKLPD